MQAGNHTSLQYSIVAVKSIPVLNSFRLLTLFASTCSPFCHLRDICSSLCHLW
ncbi:hypothetical protein HMPREF9436_01319 [Faecalibacterium cf. prausnitzii KLE1255]|uniref:Uncharacterized protein n=1 Tax=Faecalibacterium cf. prausnitzii KLE1255 TaxID=748224 RepID=E2ZI29_9FIRM|nr:hypothetical protein HMPREF9436_01319 [Faecalibacterium cf. prausnitzii KLE1255]